MFEGHLFPVLSHLRFHICNSLFSVFALKHVIVQKDLSINVSIRYIFFYISQRCKNLQERANFTSMEWHGWKIQESVNNVKSQRLHFLLRRHFQWSNDKIIKSRVPKPWSTSKKNLHEFGKTSVLLLLFKEACIVLPFWGIPVFSTERPTYRSRHYAGWHFIV